MNARTCPARATTRVAVVIRDCPPGSHIYVYREDGYTVLFCDPRSTRDDITAACLDELTDAEADVLREAYGLPTGTRELDPQVAADLLGPVGTLCDRRVPVLVRRPGYVELPYRRRSTDSVAATA